jgi:probable addiction module antidote protein
MPTIDYKEDFLMKDLQNLDRAADYLTAAIEEGEEVFLLAVRDVVEAQGGIGALAKATSLNRENLYDMLSKEGNPRLSSIMPVLDKLGFELKFTPKIHGVKAA